MGTVQTDRISARYSAFPTPAGPKVTQWAKAHQTATYNGQDWFLNFEESNTALNQAIHWVCSTTG